MTVIAWDGQSLAVDKQGTYGGVPETVSKFRELETGEVLVWSGVADQGMLLANWYANGRSTSEWPKFQAQEEFTNLIVVSKTGVLDYSQQPIAMTYEDKFLAWGSGRKLALGAMAMGATAKEAVEIACKFDIWCGMGIDTFYFGETL